MATAEKTVTFTFPMTTSLVSDETVTNLSQITLYVPESSPTFTSVFVEIGFQDVITVTGGAITEHRVGLQLASAGYSTITELDDISASGENIAGVLSPFDFTDYFNTNWTGTSMTCDLQVYFNQTTGTTQGMANVTATVTVTYTYDDQAATQIKTVLIPLESLTTTLPTTQTNFGTSQIPQLTSGGILPENGVTIRDYAFIIEGNEFTANTTDFTLSAAIDGGSSTAFMTQETALNSQRFCRWIYKPSVPDTTTSHNFQLWSDLGSRCHHVTVTLMVTYEFTLSGTSRIINSIKFPIEIASPLGVNTSAQASRFTREVMIMDGGTITMRQSGVRINYNSSASVGTHNWKVGAQSYQTYTASGATVCGMICVQQRIDSGAAQGAALTLARGVNNFVIDGYATNASNQMTNISGYVLLNYESDLASGGISQHTTTVTKVLLQSDMLLTDRNRVDNYSFSIVPSNYWLISSGFCFIQWIATASNAITFDVECLSGEGKGGGYYDIYADAYQSDAERSCSMVWMRGRDTFKRFPQDVGDDRIDIETARSYRLFTTTTCGNGILACLTYHSYTWEVAGSITGNDPGLTTQLKLVRNDTKEVLQEQTLSAGTTSYSFTVYDDTEDYYVSAYQDDTHVGRSGIGVAA